MVRIYPGFKTMIVMLLFESAATIKPLSQVIGLHVVEKLEFGGLTWNLMEETIMKSTLLTSKCGGHHPL